MEKLFKHNNIGLQQYEDEDGLDKYYAYTDKLLARNVLIEFYTAVIDDSDENYEEETAIIAHTYTEDRSFSFPLFHSLHVVGPLQLYRIIADAIDFIERSDSNNLLDDLTEISTGSTTSDMMDSVEDSERIYDNDIWEFTAVLDLIKERHKKAN